MSATLDQVELIVGETPHLLIGDKAYDSDKLDRELQDRGTQMVAPHIRGRRRKNTQDGRVLRRYKRRWKIERLFAWLFNNRRLVTRYERHPLNFLGFLHLACAMILMRRVLR